MYVNTISLMCCYLFFVKQKTAYDMGISDWSSDVCSSDLVLSDRIAIINHGRLIANEPTHELVGQAHEKQVVVTIDRDLTEVPQAPCFGRITLSAPRVVTISYDRRRVNAGDVLGALTAAGLGIVDVSTQEPALEDVFLRLTGAPADG